MLDTKSYFLLALSLGWQDVRDTYQRSTLGPLWITLGLGIQVATIGLVFGVIFGVDLTVFFPFLAVSLVLWNFLLSSMMDSTSAYMQSQQIIRQMYVPGFFPIVRVLSKNSIVLLHNAVIVVVVLAVSGISPGWEGILLLPALAIVLVSVFVVGVLGATISTRFRDVPPMISSLLTISFYLTPILWMPETLPREFRSVILTLNPFYHLMELVRAPILGSSPSLLNWLVGLGVAICLGFLARWVLHKYSWKIVYWL